MTSLAQICPAGTAGEVDHDVAQVGFARLRPHCLQFRQQRR